MSDKFLLNKAAFNFNLSYFGTNLIAMYHTIADNKKWEEPLNDDPKWHKLTFIFFIVKGTLKFKTQSSSIIVSENNIIFGQSSEDLKICDNGEAVEFYCFHFQQFGYPLVLFKSFKLDQYFFKEERFIQIYELLSSRNNLELGIGNALFQKLLYSVLIEIQERTANETPQKDNMLEIAAYINEHIREKISIEDLAKRSKMCLKMFRETFTKIIGATPKKYIDNVRLENVYNLLVSSDLTIAEIAEQYSYSSPYHLTNAFKEKYNISPSTIKKEKRTH